MPYYNSVTTSEQIDAIMAIKDHSISFASNIAIYSSAASARSMRGISTQEQLDNNLLNAYLGDDVLYPTGSVPIGSFSTYFGEGGPGSGPYNIFGMGTSDYVQNKTGYNISSLGIIHSNINSGRQFFGGGASQGAGGSGGAPALEIEFMTGGLWGPRRFADPNFSLEPVLRAGFMPPRRPAGKRGFRPKTEEADRRATLHVVGLDGKVWFSTSDFILQEVQKMEGHVATRVSTMEGSTVKFVCAKDRVFLFGGFLMNMPNYDWARNWEFYWGRYISGSTNAMNRCMTIIVYDDKLIEGYIMEYSTTSVYASEFFEPFNFKMYVSNYMIVPSISGKTEDVSDLKANINTSGSYYRQRGKTLSEATADHLLALDVGGQIGNKPSPRTEE